MKRIFSKIDFNKAELNKYAIVSENDVCFNDSILNVITYLGLPIKLKKEYKKIKLTYNKLLLDRKVVAEYSFFRNKLYSVTYSYEAFGFISIDCFLNKCEEMINNNIQSSFIYYECCDKKYWDISDDSINQHTCLFKNGNIAIITINIIAQ